MEKKMKQKTMKLRAVAVFFATLLVTMGCVFLLNQSQEKQARLKAAYTAESTVNMVESQLNKYLVESDLMKNVVESGHDTLSNYSIKRLRIFLRILRMSKN